ncbi:TetR/AcrR family transcriptional regulator [Paenibacillus chitinolyticus]|uniref:TetR/AcrR family transcriptional regulator n=1 Tax=Paenibacillus chitinolyticus TaxID=79263 RepID=A0ABT4FLM9_9BACL|nr:TetR/AcrR family transcriptional regulator [Paenibacillus chitinolyticus]MCY9598194.1 TetR/AcrR family transcriptional regulator [Paenibacillus chitinolyticus]
MKRLPRNPERDQEIRKERCDQILSAAVALFAKNGLSSTKISDIAHKAHMSHGLIYNYFQSKEEIYISIVEKNLCILTSLFEQAHRLPDASSYEKLTWLLDQVYCERWDDAVFYQVVADQILTSDSVSDQLKTSVRTSIGDNLKLLTRIFRVGQEKGELIQGDPRELAFYFMNMIQAVLLAETRGIYFTGTPLHRNLLQLFLPKA